MRLLKECFDNRIENPNDLLGNFNDKSTVRAIMNWLIDNEYRVLAVEKLVTNGQFVGVIDLIAQKKIDTDKIEIRIFEIKCRNKAEVTVLDKLQCQIYSRMLWYCKTSMLFVDKENKIIEIPVDHYKTGKKFVNNSGLLNSYLRLLQELGMNITNKINAIEIGKEK